MLKNDYLDFLAHHGILGQKWGVRRYQNKDGSYTDAGVKRRMKTNTKMKIVAGIYGGLTLLGVGLMYQNFKRSNAFNTSMNRLNIDMNKANAQVQNIQEKIAAKRAEVLLQIGKRHVTGGNFAKTSLQSITQNSAKDQAALDRINNMLADL